MQNLVIIGNSGSARECLDIFNEMLHADSTLSKRCRFKGFLAWKGYKADMKGLEHLLLGSDEEYSPQQDDVFAIGLGQPLLRKAAYEQFAQAGCRFFTLIHPWSSIAPSAYIGEANIFQRATTVHCDVRIGNANYFNGAVNLSHDVTVGDYNFFGPYALILGGASIGCCNTLSVQSTLLPGAKIGQENMIAPGAFVYKGCKNRCRLAGNPALNIGEV